jgi:hypothetical protein
VPRQRAEDMLLVAPASILAGILTLRRLPAAPVPALAPSIFASYTYTQLIVGQEYLRLPGNNERFFPLLLGIFILVGALTLRAWDRLKVASGVLPPHPASGVRQGHDIGRTTASTTCRHRSPWRSPPWERAAYRPAQAQGLSLLVPAEAQLARPGRGPPSPPAFGGTACPAYVGSSRPAPPWRSCSPC